MAKDRLIIDERRGVYRICWYFPDSGDEGAYLGDYLKRNTSTTDSEHRVATEAAQSNSEVDSEGLYWETLSTVKKALAAAKASLKVRQSAKPWPEWAKQALAAGWKPPKGWQP